MGKYEIMEKIVHAGNSKVFKNWHENAGVTMEDFLDGLRWLCDDPMTDGKMRRELGCIRRADSGWSDADRKIIDGCFWPDRPGVVGLHRLTRVYYQDGSFCGLYDENGRLWGGNTEYASINVRNRI